MVAAAGGACTFVAEQRRVAILKPIGAQPLVHVGDLMESSPKNGKRTGRERTQERVGTARNGFAATRGRMQGFSSRSVPVLSVLFPFFVRSFVRSCPFWGPGAQELELIFVRSSSVPVPVLFQFPFKVGPCLWMRT